MILLKRRPIEKGSILVKFTSIQVGNHQPKYITIENVLVSRD